MKKIVGQVDDDGLEPSVKTRAQPREKLGAHRSRCGYSSAAFSIRARARTLGCLRARTREMELLTSGAAGVLLPRSAVKTAAFSSSGRRFLAKDSFKGKFRPDSSVHAQRPTWIPGLDPPPHLDGTLAGDFGFDPLGLGEDPESLKWYVQAELVHCRFAMAGVAGILFTDLLRVTGMGNLPVWYEAGAVKYGFANTETLIIVQLILMGFVETKRYMDFVNPRSQAKDGTFFGLEASLEGLAPGYPGGPLFNPLGLAKDIESAHDWKLKEIKNGRLAMIAMAGFFAQASVTHVGPVDNLLVHLSDPWHRTVVQSITGTL